jgi:N-acetyl sugar amidotransferase
MSSLDTVALEPASAAGPQVDQASYPGAAGRVCVRCLMDQSDPAISFGTDGICSHCRRYEKLAAATLRTGDEGTRQLGAIADQIRAAGKGKRYDCVMGVSGGVDSTYVAYVATRLGLRPLAVHMDNGWDSELAVKNIERVLAHLRIDLHTEVLDWEEFRDLQLSFLKASVPDGEIPTDHAIGAVIYRVAARHGISYIISGSNVVTEGILPGTWTYGVWDYRYIAGVQRRFGSVPLRTFPHYSLAHLFHYTSVRKIRTVRPLNYIPYVKHDVMKILENELGWRYYGGKHYESIYTRFFQGYVLPRKFGIDKRKAHLSTLINSGQISREAALTEIATNGYAGKLQAEDREYTIKKLGVTPEAFEAIMNLPVRSHADYPNLEGVLRGAKNIVRTAQRWRLLPQSLEGAI